MAIGISLENHNNCKLTHYVVLLQLLFHVAFSALHLLLQQDFAHYLLYLFVCLVLSFSFLHLFLLLACVCGSSWN